MTTRNRVKFRLDGVVVEAGTGDNGSEGGSLETTSTSDVKNITIRISEAGTFVDKIIKKAVGYVELLTGRKYDTYPRPPEKEGTCICKNVSWPTIGSFDIEAGKESIDKLIKTWRMCRGWLYCLDFLQTERGLYEDRYIYEAKWSIPTRKRPIPVATASVFFTLKVSKIKPKNMPVEVFYVMEGCRFEHRPGEREFNEQWVRDIIVTKMNLFPKLIF